MGELPRLPSREFSLCKGLEFGGALISNLPRRADMRPLTRRTLRSDAPAGQHLPFYLLPRPRQFTFSCGQDDEFMTRTIIEFLHGHSVSRSFSRFNPFLFSFACHLLILLPSKAPRLLRMHRRSSAVFPCDATYSCIHLASAIGSSVNIEP